MKLLFVFHFNGHKITLKSTYEVIEFQNFPGKHAEQSPSPSILPRHYF